MPPVRKGLLFLSLSVLALLYYHLAIPASPAITTIPKPAAMGSTNPLRLAILMCDTPQPKTLARVGTYEHVFSELLAAATAPEPLSSQLHITAHDIVADPSSYPSLDSVDALLLTGSKHDSFKDDPWILKLVEYTKQALDTGRVKLIGVCFGHQIIARAVGAGVGRSDKGWEIAVTDVELTDKGKEIFALDTMRIQQMHQDIVYTYPEDAIPLARNDICEVQGMYLPGRYVTVQGHPEFTEELITEVITNRHNAGVFTDEMYDAAMKRAGQPHDGVAIAKGFLRFLKSG